MSYTEFHPMMHGEAMDAAKAVRERLEQSTQTIMQIISYNAEYKPKPHHMNKDLMTTALRLEQI